MQAAFADIKGYRCSGGYTRPVPVYKNIENCKGGMCMTSAPVKDIVRAVGYINETGSAKSAGDTDFRGSLKNAMESRKESVDLYKAAAGSASSFTAVKNRELDKTVERTDKKGMATKEGYRDNSAKVSGEGASKKESIKSNPDVTDTAKQKAEGVVSEIAKTMDVSEEEVTKAMAVLGLTLADILTPAGIADLVTELSGNKDAISLITDENLYQTLENLQNFAADTSKSLMEELDLSQEALDEVLKQTEELLQPMTAEEEIQSTPGEVAEKGALAVGDDEFTQTDNKDAKNLGAANGAETPDEAYRVYESLRSVRSATGEQSDNGRPSGEENNNSRQDASFFNQSIQLNNNTALPAAEQSLDIPSYISEYREIAEQIIDSIRANVRPELTELEMSLHPASLGNVRVNLAAANGQVTAEFIAQNETVRAAIESQVSLLVKQLEEQGVKIEAVEVTLAGHQFESSYGNNGQNEEHTGSERTGQGVSRIRRLNLDELGAAEDMDELDEQDRIVAEMMAENGGTVDYTA